MSRLLAGFSFLLAATATVWGQLDWGIDRQITSGALGQYGIGADRTPGPDTAFVGAIRSATGGDTVQLFRSTDRGENWGLIWQAQQTNQRLSNLALRVGAGIQNWVFMFWVADDGMNNGDIRGVRVAFDGVTAEPLYPTVPGSRDTLRWLAATRSFTPDYRLHLFWQDEAGLTGLERNPVIKHSYSTDFGSSWTWPQEVMYGFETPAVDYGAPGYLYLACRSVTKEDIGLAATTNGGDSWRLLWLTRDTTSNNDMFPSVAATHDSAAGSRAWVSYDSHRPAGWGIYCAYTTNGGTTWALGQPVSSGGRNQFWSNLECAGYGSRQTRVTYLSDSDTTHGYRVYYRTGTTANPAQWSPALVLSDRDADNSMAPVVANYGVTSDTVNQGMVFYAEPGPVNLWYDAYQFVNIREEHRTHPGNGLSAKIASGAVIVEFNLALPGKLRLALYEINGRLISALNVGSLPAGSHTVRLPVAALVSGVYIVRLTAESVGPRATGRGCQVTQSATCKLVKF